MKKTFLAAIMAAIAFPVSTTFAAPDVKNFGKGVWIYYIKDSGTPEAIAQRAEWAGLDYLIVKTHDGAKWHRNWKSGKFQQLVSHCHQRGIKVYAFGYNYGRYPEKEAQRIIDSLGASDGYIYNAESDFGAPS